MAALLQMFQNDPDTKVILLIGEVGGCMEEEAAVLVRQGAITKPVAAYLAGRSAPPGKRMGHAGAIIADGRGSVESKRQAFAAAGIPLAATPNEVVLIMDRLLLRPS